MRQLGTLPTENQARQLAAYLVTQRIDADAESEANGWVVWVRDEDQLAQAREIFAHFQAQPTDARYAGAEKQAENFRREEAQRRKSAQKNVVEMRGKWGTGTPSAGHCPLVVGMMAASVLVFLFTGFGGQRESVLLNGLLFLGRTASQADVQQYGMFAQIAQGQVWRLITPIFVHYGPMHIIFNMWMFFAFGSQIEQRRGTFAFGTLCLTIAVVSNVAQAVAAPSFFAGMSGVVYGLLGDLWMKVRYDNSAGFQLHPQTIFIAMLWFVLCILAAMPPLDAVLGSQLGNVANVVHAAGLLVGMAIGYAPVLLKRSRS